VLLTHIIVACLLYAGFFSSSDSELSKQFKKLADALSDDVRFAHTFEADVAAKYGYNE